MELMIVIIILGLMASLVMPNIVGKSEEAKRKLVCVQMKSLSESLKMFKVEQGVYPSTEEGLNALIKNPDEEKYPSYPRDGYLSDGKMPKDSWNNSYIYLFENEKFDLLSLGADRKEGGEGDAADIKFSECK
jgi:general secretion pathway protein G